MRRFATIISLAICVIASGCWNDPVTSFNTLPFPDAECAPGEGDVHDTGNTPADPGPCDCLTAGSWYRFDTLGLSSLDGEVHPVIATLNPLWLADMGISELNILFELVEVAQDSLTVRAVNGARVGTDGDICILDETAVSFDFPRDGCALHPSQESAINVYAGDETHPKNCTTVLPVQHAIPVQKVVLEANLSDSCDRINDGNVVSGVIGREELLSTCTCLTFGGDLSHEACGELDPDYVSDDGFCKGCNDTYINLEELLNSFGALDYKCTTVTDGDAVCIDGFFSAYLLDSAPPSCGD